MEYIFNLLKFINLLNSKYVFNYIVYIHNLKYIITHFYLIKYI